MLTRTVENAQKKVEEQNFLIRKRVLEYDDVMNEQRRVIYKYRREILEGRDMSDVARARAGGRSSARCVDELHAGRGVRGLGPGGAPDPGPAALALDGRTSQAMQPETVDREELRESLLADALAAYDRREEEFGDELMR